MEALQLYICTHVGGSRTTLGNMLAYGNSSFFQGATSMKVINSLMEPREVRGHAIIRKVYTDKTVKLLKGESNETDC